MEKQVIKMGKFSAEYFGTDIENGSEEVKEISVVVASYNPKWDKMQRTLDSIIEQKNIDIEIVITDDGSLNSMYNQVVNYLIDHGVENFIYVSHESNSGT